MKQVGYNMVYSIDYGSLRSHNQL